MGDKNYCYPLDILDDHSRFLIRIKPHLNTVNVVVPTFLEAFREYGLPNSILSDNGAQFAGFKKGYTQFERWLMDLDILPVHGRIKHPQTQGKIERFHRTMKEELEKRKLMGVSTAFQSISKHIDIGSCLRNADQWSGRRWHLPRLSYWQGFDTVWAEV